MRTDTSSRRSSGRLRRKPRTALRAAAVAIAVLAAATTVAAVPASAAAPAPAPAMSAMSAASAVPGAVAATPEAELAALAVGYPDCPRLPAGAEPSRWRCEVHLASPRLRLGAVDIPALRPIMMVHAEGPMPDGTPGQVWGSWRSAGPSAVPGGLTGTRAGDRSRLLGLSLELSDASRVDFYTGATSARFALVGPLVPDGCTVGGSVPVNIALKRAGSSQWISRNPPLVHFSAYDDTFAAPAPEGCGPLTGLLSRRLGLPASGGNVLSYDASYTFRMYDRLG